MVYERIAEYIASNGILQTSVARKAGMTKQALSDSLRGVRKLSAEEYVAICHALNVGVEKFAEENDYSQQPPEAA